MHEMLDSVFHIFQSGSCNSIYLRSSWFLIKQTDAQNHGIFGEPAENRLTEFLYRNQLDARSHQPFRRMHEQNTAPSRRAYYPNRILELCRFVCLA